MMHQGLCDVSLIFLGFPLTVMHRSKVSFHSLPVKSLGLFPLHSADQGVSIAREPERANNHSFHNNFLSFSPGFYFFFLRFIFWNFHRPWRVRGTSGYEHATNHPIKKKPCFISHKPKKVSLEGFFSFLPTMMCYLQERPRTHKQPSPFWKKKTRHFPEGKKVFLCLCFPCVTGMVP